jgi:hypothetical protein
MTVVRGKDRATLDGGKRRGPIRRRTRKPRPGEYARKGKSFIVQPLRRIDFETISRLFANAVERLSPPRMVKWPHTWEIRPSRYAVFMTDIRINRKLAAILAADVVGYSRLMEADEAGTLLGH